MSAVVEIEKAKRLLQLEKMRERQAAMPCYTPYRVFVDGSSISLCGFEDCGKCASCLARKAGL